ncbi:MAG: hypothetical protein HY248_05150 [Fimbriimonas ginsengisoli]|uniref:Uncharacterized protein n=1 Tax=Fimbriimonas ginsengisoli TaxID=1005039 RepID=A0A931PSR1_FIMGI|nr:hypothetical protein [Fimbriimonas ginsengisoli]MBI3721923.1 hypothetical protein [Fimbriimonas ginsengisoli]
MPNVVFTVDCEGAHHDRCYTRDYIRVFEEEFVPSTWLIHVSMKDPSANTNLYYHEFVHKIPSWHEMGMKVNFENERGYVDDEKERGNIIWIAKDTLKSHMIKCTSFRAGAFALVPSDVKYLEEGGILVDSSIVPDASYKMFVNWEGAPHEPYHSACDNLHREGGNRILHVPIATHDGQHGYLDAGFAALEPLFAANLSREVICLGLRDYYDSVDDLRKTIRYFRHKGAHFTTLTQAASEHYEHHAPVASV